MKNYAGTKVALAEQLGQPIAREPRHSDVQKDEVRFLSRDQDGSAQCVRMREHQEAGILKALSRDFQGDCVVVDDENLPAGRLVHPRRASSARGSVLSSTTRALRAAAASWSTLVRQDAAST